nr:phosphoribosylformylglycinamidine synthase [uncultured Oscillibacter sp.]
MVRRVYAEKKPALRLEAQGLLNELRTILGVSALTGLRLVNRYDVEGIADGAFQKAKTIVFSEPQVDLLYEEDLPLPEGPHAVLAVEALPGQFDQRADSAAQCVQLMAGVERPLVSYAKVYLLEGALSAADLEKIRGYVINPVESREAALDKPETLVRTHAAPRRVEILAGFTAMDEAALRALLEELGLAMDLDDLRFLQGYFRDTEQRDPTVTEVRVVDTYWSDHCRHTTFSTHLEGTEIQDPSVRRAYEHYRELRSEVYGEGARERPETLMDIATIAAKALKKRGLLPELDESEEINACSIHVPAEVDGEVQDWLLMFKNETHNHPTEIEPFGGAATCIGGCIRDPLSGRAYVHQAMRVTGCGDPRTPLADTLPGKLPQRKLCQTAAAGYSSYGNQIGLATGHVAELYHPGYVAKHLEVGAVVGAVPAGNVRRERPVPGDVIVLLGGRTGRDGIGGATGSSKSHNAKSLQTMASEVQKGNAPEERKIQRLFRDGAVTRLIKRCNDFGAGGVSVAIGELADGLTIDLDAVRKKYDGLDGTELAISESQERMAVVVAPEDAEKFIAAAKAENLEAYQVAVVTEEPRMVMQWQGETIVDLSREFLDSNGAVKHARVFVPPHDNKALSSVVEDRFRTYEEMASSLTCASRQGLVERFDSTIGAGSLLMPFGGKYQKTPAQVMAALLPVLPGQETEQGSVMAWGCDPDTISASPFCGAYQAVEDSITKLVAAGADYRKVYLTLQEYFEKLHADPKRWGKPFAALLGAMEAQMDFGAAAIGGKDSMSGSFLDMDVPPTLISFAIAPIKAGELITPEFKEPGHPVYFFCGGGETGDIKENWDQYHALCQAGKVKAAWALTEGAAGEAIMKMSFGNRIGFDVKNIKQKIESYFWSISNPHSIIAELSEEIPESWGISKIGETVAGPTITLSHPRFKKPECYSIDALLSLNEAVLEDVYPTRAPAEGEAPLLPCPAFTRPAPKIGAAKPKVLIPVFPGTNCEYDSARAAQRAGLETEIFVVGNQSAQDVADSAAAFARKLRESQILFLPGGFSGGDEPDGSGKFITAFLRGPETSEAVMDLLKDRDGLALGICNGFQALIKLGLVPYGEIRDTDETCPTLSFNTIGRHQSKIVNTRIVSNKSPWLARVRPGEVYAVPISHGEGRFLCSEGLLETLAEGGQIATQYADLEGLPTMDPDFDPNGSAWAVEGITSPDGRVFGKMGHAERIGPGLYRNVPGRYDLQLFQAAKDYFRVL